MAILLRTCMFLGIVLIFLSVITGMGSKTKPPHSQYLMTAGLISLALWVGGGMLWGLLAKDDAPQIDAPKDKTGD